MRALVRTGEQQNAECDAGCHQDCALTVLQMMQRLGCCWQNGVSATRHCCLSEMHRMVLDSFRLLRLDLTRSEIWFFACELAVQMANKSTRTPDRDNVQPEVVALLNQVDLIAENTWLNDVVLLDGTHNDEHSSWQ